jgi:hypothetical protein
MDGARFSNEVAMKRNWKHGWGVGAAVCVLLAGAMPAAAQVSVGGAAAGPGSTISSGAGGGSFGSGGGLGGGSVGIGSFGSGSSFGNSFSNSSSFGGGGLSRTGGSSFGLIGGSLTPGAGGGSLALGQNAALGGAGATNNPFMASYANPLALGLGTRTGQVAFGTPLYGTVATRTTATPGAAVTPGAAGVPGAAGTAGTAGIFSTSGYSGAAPVGGSSIGVRRAPQYLTTLGEGFAPRVAAPVELRLDLQQVVARATSLPSRDNIQVVMDGETVVLRGLVANARERRLAEGMVRLSPGVRYLRNELAVQTIPVR